MLIANDRTSDYSIQLRSYSEQLDIATDLSDIQEIIENMEKKQMKWWGPLTV